MPRGAGRGRDLFSTPAGAAAVPVVISGGGRSASSRTPTEERDGDVTEQQQGGRVRPAEHACSGCMPRARAATCDAPDGRGWHG